MKHLQSKQHSKGMDVIRARALAHVEMPVSICRALFDGWCGHGGTYVQDPFELNGCWIHRRMHSAPDTEDGTQPGSTQWSEPVARRNRTSAYAPTYREA